MMGFLIEFCGRSRLGRGLLFIRYLLRQQESNWNVAQSLLYVLGIPFIDLLQTPLTLIYRQDNCFAIFLSALLPGLYREMRGLSIKCYYYAESSSHQFDSFSIFLLFPWILAANNAIHLL